jgi:hypothetical protein
MGRLTLARGESSRDHRGSAVAIKPELLLSGDEQEALRLMEIKFGELLRLSAIPG